MKTRFFMLASALMCGAVLFSCAKEEIDAPAEKTVENTKVKDYVITASSEDSATKAELASGNNIFWQEGDQISVISSVKTENEKAVGYNDIFTLSSEAGSYKGDFKGVLSNPELPHVAIYPYDEQNTYAVGENGSGLAYWQNSFQQTAVKGSFDPKACLMAGTMKEGSVAFNNLCSYIKFEIDFECTSIVISAKDDKQSLVSESIYFQLNSDGTLNENSIGRNPLSTFSEKERTVTLVGENGKNISAGTYYVAVLPTQKDHPINGLTFTFTAAVGKTFTKTTKEGATIDFKRNHIVNVGKFPLDMFAPSDEVFLGSGTESDPYLISSLDKLELLEEKLSHHDKDPKYTENTYFLQTCDIDCGGKMISIGHLRQTTESGGDIFRPFNGVYDGGGYTISNYCLKPVLHASGYYAGLFNNVQRGTIRNLNVAPNAEIIDMGKDGQDYHFNLYAGALIGYSGIYHNNQDGVKTRVIVENCHLVGGGNYRIINYYGNSSSHPEVIFGGLIGLNRGYLEMRNCSNEAELYVSPGVVGGLIGSYQSAQSLDSSFTDQAENKLVIDRCRNNGDLECSSSNYTCIAGGFLGNVPYDSGSTGDYVKNLEAHISNSVNSGTVKAYGSGSKDSGAACAGGFIGYLEKMTCTSYFHNCLNKGHIISGTSGSGIDRAGGFIGYSAVNNNTAQNPDQDGSGDHVYAAMCVNVGQIEGNANYKASFCATKDGLKCVNCLWLDEHDYSDKDGEGKAIPAVLPTRPEVPAVADYDHDNYYYKTINPDTIFDAFAKMINTRKCKYDNDKFVLRWGYIDGENRGWKFWTAAWKGSATWGEATSTLDIDFDNLIPEIAAK